MEGDYLDRFQVAIRPRNRARDFAIHAAWKAGASTATLAAEHGLTRQRVNQITSVVEYVQAVEARQRARQEAVATLDGVRLRDAFLRVRARNCLLNGGYETMGAVARASDADLLGIPNMGRRTLAGVRREVERLLAEGKDA